MRAIAFLNVLLFPAVAFAGPVEDFKKVMEAYVKARSYASHFELEVTQFEEGRLRAWKVKGETAYVAPNKFLLRMEDPIGGFIVACDGGRVVSYLWPHMEYRVDPAPKGLKEFRADPLLGLPERGPIVWQLLCAPSVEAMLGDVKSVSVRPEREAVIYEVRTDLKGEKGRVMSRFAFKVVGRNRQIQEVMVELSVADEKGKVVAYVIKETHHRARLDDVDVEPSKFRFSLPKGARKVGEFSLPYP